MSAYIVILIGLSAAVVLIGIYGYIDYMSDRHVSDMYTGLRDMMESIKERLRILEDTVEAMNKAETATRKETASNIMQDEKPHLQAPKVSKPQKVTLTEPMNIITNKEIKL